MSNETEYGSLKISVKYKIFSIGCLRDSVVTVAAGVEVNFCPLERKESLISLLLGL